jgi:hypothetical protein
MAGLMMLVVEIFSRSRHLVPSGVAKKYVDAFSERQTLNKNRGGALWSGADGPRHRAERFTTWHEAAVLSGQARTVRDLVQGQRFPA